MAGVAIYNVITDPNTIETYPMPISKLTNYFSFEIIIIHVTLTLTCGVREEDNTLP